MNNKNYTAEEIELIRTSYSSQGAEWLARELGRSASAIRCKASHMGLHSSFRRRPRKKQPLQPSSEQQPIQPSDRQTRRKPGRSRKQGRPEVREVERTQDPARHIKADNLSNYDPEGVRRAQQAEAAASADKVMLRIDERTHILVPRHLATPQYAEQVRRRWNRNRTSHHG